MSDVATSEPPLARRLSGFSFARQWRLTRKELAETLRDRRTIVTLLLMPILVYPLLSIIFRQFLTTSISKPGGTIVIIGVDDEASERLLVRWLDIGGEILAEQAERETPIIEPPLVAEPETESIHFDIGEAAEKLKAGRVDVAVKVKEGPPARLEITYPQRSAIAAELRSFIERRIRAFNWGAEEVAAKPDESNVAAIQMMHAPLVAKAAPRSLLPSIVPLVLLMMTITGAVYPAIDLTAGERERGTLEALIAAPVSRVGVLMAKYVAVLVVALLTAGMNLAAMSLTIYSAGLMGLLLGPNQNALLLGLEMLGLLLLFAGFFSALLLAVTSFAKSFKEAQAYLIPLMLVTLAPGLMSLSPQLELTGPLAVVPLVNVVLLARDVFSGGASLLTTLTVVVSTMLYAAVSIALAARIFGSDAILYGSGGSWADLFRRSRQPLAAPTLMTALLCLAIVFAAMINLGGAGLMLTAGSDAGVQLATSALMTALVFAAIPLLAATSENVQLSTGFRGKLPAFRFWVAGALLGVSLGLLVSQLMLLAIQSEVVTVNKALEEVIKKKAEEFNSQPLLLVLVTLAFVPAIAEELFFRGYLLRALEVRWPGLSAVFATAVLFALFHTFGTSGITLERLAPSLLLGIALGLLAQRSGSVWPGMLLHVLNNSLLWMIALRKDWLLAQGFLTPESEHFPALWLALAAGLAVVGLVLLFWPGRAGDAAVTTGTTGTLA